MGIGKLAGHFLSAERERQHAVSARLVEQRECRKEAVSERASEVSEWANNDDDEWEG